VIIGKLIPAATGLRRYRRLEIEPTEPMPRATDEIGLLDDAELAAELGLDRDLDFSFGDGGDGFGDELADLATPSEEESSS
jgi:DNA-directed RNA polymerase subunit beta'